MSTTHPGATLAAAPTIDEVKRAHGIASRIADVFAATVVGQHGLLTSLLVTLTAEGHILLESVPGLAKTTAAKTLAASVQASFHRIQCTPDLLPSDIVGTQIFDHTKGVFENRLGPVHANFVLLDEINRSSAKTQSAMLEAMQERQTSIGGTIYPLPQPFMVLATQNPIEQEGTYTLPEAQMDRFLLKEVLTYPTVDEELEILRRHEVGQLRGDQPNQVAASLDDVLFLQSTAARLYVDDSIKRYIVSLVDATRRASDVIGPELGRYVEIGSSPRGAMALQSAARALAVLNGRGNVIPEDVKNLRHDVLRHRIMLTYEALAEGIRPEQVIDEIFARVAAP